MTKPQPLFQTLTETARGWLRSARYQAALPAYIPVEKDQDRTYLRYDAIELDLTRGVATVRYLHQGIPVAYGNQPLDGTYQRDIITLADAQGRIPVTYQGDMAVGAFPQLRRGRAVAFGELRNSLHIVLGLLLGGGIIAVTPAPYIAPLAVLSAFALFASSFLPERRP